MKNGDFPAIGTIVKFIGGVKEFEFRGADREGRIILSDRTSGISRYVKAEEICWTPIIKKDPKPTPP